MSSTAGIFGTCALLLAVAAFCLWYHIPQIESELQTEAIAAATALGAADPIAVAHGEHLTVTLAASNAALAPDIERRLRQLPLAGSVTVDVLGDDAPEPSAAVERPGPELNDLESEVNELARSLRVEFATGTAELTAEARGTLDQVADFLRSRGLKLEVAGHTDASGDSARNLELSQRRAEAVVTYLSAVGLEFHRMTPIGYGDTRPIADNGTAEGRRANRRVEFKLERGEDR